MVFPWQEDWSGLPFPSPRDLPDPGIKPASPTLTGGFFTTEPPGKRREEYQYETSLNQRWAYNFSLCLSPQLEISAVQHLEVSVGTEVQETLLVLTQGVGKRSLTAWRKERNLSSFLVSFSSVVLCPSSLTILWQRQQQQEQLAVGNCKSQGSKLRDHPVGKAVVMKGRAEAWLASPTPSPPSALVQSQKQVAADWRGDGRSSRVLEGFRGGK